MCHSTESWFILLMIECLSEPTDGTGQRSGGGSGPERRVRPKLRRHVQAAHHRQQQCGKDVLPVPLRRRLLHIGLCQHGGHRLQSQDHLQEQHQGQTSDLGEKSVKSGSLGIFLLKQKRKSKQTDRSQKIKAQKSSLFNC